MKSFPLLLLMFVICLACLPLIANANTLQPFSSHDGLIAISNDLATPLMQEADPSTGLASHNFYLAMIAAEILQPLQAPDSNHLQAPVGQEKQSPQQYSKRSRGREHFVLFSRVREHRAARACAGGACRARRANK